jgi:hypothetical protein
VHTKIRFYLLEAHVLRRGLLNKKRLGVDKEVCEVASDHWRNCNLVSPMWHFFSNTLSCNGTVYSWISEPGWTCRSVQQITLHRVIVCRRLPICRTFKLVQVQIQTKPIDVLYQCFHVTDGKYAWSRLFHKRGPCVHKHMRKVLHRRFWNHLLQVVSNAYSTDEGAIPNSSPRSV